MDNNKRVKTLGGWGFFLFLMVRCAFANTPQPVQAPTKMDEAPSAPANVVTIKPTTQQPLCQKPPEGTPTGTVLKESSYTETTPAQLIQPQAPYAVHPVPVAKPAEPLSP